MVLSALSDFLVAMGRIGKFLTAEELAESYTIDVDRKNAVEVDGDFSWETAGKITESKFAKDGKGTGRKGGKKDKKTAKGEKSQKQGLPLTVQDVSNIDAKEDEKPFELKNLKLSIPRGSFVAIVGTVGSGKSSILNALIGEMRRTRGGVVFGGSVAYVPQTPWIRNATLKANVLFDLEEDNEK